MKISLVIPLCNEEATLPKLLESVARQTRPPDEVVCVDAGSTDRTPQYVGSFGAGFPILLLRGGQMNPGEARNEGVRRARHDWLAFTDGGIRLDPTWLETLEAAANATGASIVFGGYEPVCDTFFRRCAALAYVPARRGDGLRGPSVVSLLLKRSVYDAAGGFPDYRASEDLIFLERLAAAESKIAVAPDAVARWEIAGGPLTTFARFALYSKANLAAGRGRFWHLGVARQYLALTVLLVVLLLFGVGWWSLALIPCWLAARTLKAGWLKRRSLPFGTLLPTYLAGAVAVLTVVDLATLFGTLWWLVDRPTSPRA